MTLLASKFKAETFLYESLKRMMLACINMVVESPMALGLLQD